MENTLKLTKQKSRELQASSMTLADIYKIMFSFSDKVIAEHTERGKIVAITYEEADRQIEKIAGAIQSRLGADHRFIGVACENCYEWIVLFWAVIRSGNKPYLINMRHPEALSISILDTLGAKAVISYKCGSDFKRNCVKYEELDKIDAVCRDDFEDCVALSTSATTLKAKICLYSGKELSNQMLNTKGILENNDLIRTHYKGRLKLLAFVPFYHIFGLVAVFLWFCFFGRTIVFMRDYSSDTILRTIKKHEVTHIFAVPLFWHTIEKTINEKIRREDDKTQEKYRRGLELSRKLQSAFPKAGRKIAAKMLSDVRSRLFGDSVVFCISGGSYIKDSSLELLNLLGYPLHNGYGMSEVGITSVELSENIKYRLKNSIGKPFDSVEYKIEDNKLFIRGESICHNIIIDGEAYTVNDWFDTNDICEKDKDGRYYIKGRAGDIIISDDGENINPDVIERQFDLRAAKNFSILGDCDKNTVEMIVQVPRNLIALQKSAIIASLHSQNDKLPISQRVKRFFFTYDPIMKESAIKVSRDYLREHIALGDIKLLREDEFSSDDRSTPAEEENELTEIIRSLFAECLSKDESEIGADDHFITTLGGTSLDYFNLISLVNERFSVDMRLDYTHACYTVSTFAKTVKELIS